MKTMKKFASLLLALAMIFALATAAFAQDVGTAAEGTGSITIENASKGVAYKIVKLFSASVTGTEGGSIVYTGKIPDALSDYFTKDDNGYITVVDGKSDTDVTAAVAKWAKEQTENEDGVVSDGTSLTFQGLDYGYYAVVSTQGALVTINSTNPNATVEDKNHSTPSVPSKEVDDDNVKIGDTVTYTVTFTTANYNEDGKIISYTIHDDLPEFLDNVTVTGITVGGKAITTQQFGDDKKITIPWVNDTGAHLYDNGAEVVITYTAVVTDKADVDGDGNTNTVSLSWNGKEAPDKYKDTETIYTYALALKKVNDKGTPLSGAIFQFPFYVKETVDTDGAYIYAGTEEGDGLTKTITTPADGVIIVKGLEAGEKVTITETAAPAGYNKLTGSVEVTPVQTGETTTNTTVYLDATGNITDTQTETVVEVKSDEIAATAIVVVNKSGATLPSTGGMGTTLFYVVGGILVAAAAVLLVTKKRMAN